MKSSTEVIQDALDFRTIEQRRLSVDPPQSGDAVRTWEVADHLTGERYEGKTLHDAVEAARRGEQA